MTTGALYLSFLLSTIFTFHDSYFTFVGAIVTAYFTERSSHTVSQKWKGRFLYIIVFNLKDTVRASFTFKVPFANVRL